MAENEFMHYFLAAGQTSVSNLLLQHFHELGLTNDELLVYLQLESFHAQGNDFPDIKVVAQRLRLSEPQIYQILHRMIQKKVLAIETSQDAAGRNQDHYNFDLLFQKLAQLVAQKQVQAPLQAAKADSDSQRQAVFNRLETEFGRPLSPIELETVSAWLDQDHYQPELIQLALREAVLNQAYSLKYMDRILLSWERQHLTSKAQIQQAEKRRRAKKAPQPTSQKQGPEIPMYNWAQPDPKPEE